MTDKKNNTGIDNSGRFSVGSLPWNKGLSGYIIDYPIERKLKRELSADHRRHIAQAVPRGDRHSSWKGGIYPANLALRHSVESRIWRDAILKRDGYKCVWCGGNQHLEADHIKPFALFPELRFAIDNGRTLCVDCHKKTDTFGGRKNIKQELNNPITKR